MNKLNSYNPETQERVRGNETERQALYERTLAQQFASLPMIIFLDQKAGKLTHMDVCLYCYLLALQRKNKSSYWTIESLSLLTGISEGGVKTSLRRLRNCGHIERKRTQSSAHTICLTKIESDAQGTWLRIKGEKGSFFARK